MDDRDFFDELYTLWSKTTGSADTFWMPEEAIPGLLNLYSVARNEESGEWDKTFLASALREEDAEWIAGVHGCFGDLVRRLHAALDEADAADQNRDSRECRIAELELENQELRQIIQNLSNDPPWHQRG